MVDRRSRSAVRLPGRPRDRRGAEVPPTRSPRATRSLPVTASRGWSGFARGTWATRLVAENELTSDATQLHFNAKLRAYDGADCFFDRNWDFDIPRDFL